MGHRVDAHQSPQEVVAGLGVEVAARPPGAVGRVDLLNEVVGEDVVVVASLDQDKPDQEQPQRNHPGSVLSPPAYANDCLRCPSASSPIVTAPDWSTPAVPASYWLEPGSCT